MIDIVLNRNLGSRFETKTISGTKPVDFDSIQTLRLVEQYDAISSFYSSQEMISYCPVVGKNGGEETISRWS
jgi:hypothetical protein